MTTLSLPKKPQAAKPPERQLAAETTVANLVGMYAVTRQPFDSTTCKFTSVHLTQERAEAEAKRLCELHSKARFLVVEILLAVE